MNYFRKERDDLKQTLAEVCRERDHEPVELRAVEPYVGLAPTDDIQKRARYIGAMEKMREALK